MRPYRIDAAAKLVGLSAGTLRAWERRGLFVPRRTAAGHRLYSTEDVRRLVRMRHMRNVMGINPAGIAAMLSPAERNTSAPSTSDPTGVGQQLRALRQARGMTLASVSAKTGLSRSFISMVERSMAAASVASLKTLADTYGVTVRKLLGSEDTAERALVRSKSRRILPQLAPGIAVEELAEGKRMMVCQLVTIAPGSGSGGTYAHEGEEFVFVLRGQLEVLIEGIDRYCLGRGDSLYFPSNRGYAWTNPGRADAKVLWMATPGTF